MAENKNILRGALPDFEKAEMDLLRNALKRSYTERFKMMTTLMKMNYFLKKATITHKPFPVSNT
jgi:hypothetical protein